MSGQSGAYDYVMTGKPKKTMGCDNLSSWKRLEPSHAEVNRGSIREGLIVILSEACR
jgi:hypothetical protein